LIDTGVVTQPTDMLIFYKVLIYND